MPRPSVFSFAKFGLKLVAPALVASLFLAAPIRAQEEAAPPKVSVAAAYTKEITQEVSFIGRAEAIDDVDIVARVSGFLQEVMVDNGAHVEKDQMLFQIEPDLYQATLDARKADLDRQMPIWSWQRSNWRESKNCCAAKRSRPLKSMWPAPMNWWPRPRSKLRMPLSNKQNLI